MEGPPKLSPGALEGRREEAGAGDVFRLRGATGGPSRGEAMFGDAARMLPFGCDPVPGPEPDGKAEADANAEADASAYWAWSADMARVVWREKEPGWRAGEEAAGAARAAAREN